MRRHGEGAKITTSIGLLLMLVACGPCGGSTHTPTAPLHDETAWPEPLEDGAILRWRAIFPRGREEGVIDAAHHLSFRQESTNTREYERTMDLEALTALRDDLANAGCCNLQGPWSADAEYMVDMRLRLPGVDCDVVMPALFFEASPGALFQCEQRIREEWLVPRTLVRDAEQLPWWLYLGPDRHTAAEDAR